MAVLLGVSTSAIQRIELGHLPLSEKLAERISWETGVCFDYLLRGNHTWPPTNRDRTPLTKLSFELLQAERKRPKRLTSDAAVARRLASRSVRDLIYEYRKASRVGKAELLHYRLNKLLDEFNDEFTLYARITPGPLEEQLWNDRLREVVSSALPTPESFDPDGRITPEEEANLEGDFVVLGSLHDDELDDLEFQAREAAEKRLSRRIAKHVSEKPSSVTRKAKSKTKRSRPKG